MRVTCTTCAQRVGSYTHCEYDSEGHGIKPQCDQCSGLAATRARVRVWAKDYTLLSDSHAHATPR